MAPAFPIEYTGVKESNNCSQKSCVSTMAKSGKFPVGGNPRGGFVSDYNRVVEASSEGLGSSGHVDTEMTLSEDSYSPKRKCIRLNGDGNGGGHCHDQFGVPVQVVSFSKLSKRERKELEVRLRRELEEIRVLQKRVASCSMGACFVSPESDFRGFSDGQKRVPLENAPRLPERPAQGKKQPSIGGRNGARVKKGVSGKIDVRKQGASVNNSNSVLMKRCENLLNCLMGHQFGWVFNEPVDVVKLNIPDYLTVIKHPMDLGTVKNKLSRGEYASPAEFAADVRLTFSNAMKYNPIGHDVHFMAQTLSKNFEQRWKVIEKKMPTNADVQVVPTQMYPSVRNEPAVVDNLIPPSKKKKVAPDGCLGKPEPVKRVMTDDDRQKLSTELESLLSELPDSIVDFLKENSSGGQDDEFEIDFDALSDDILFKLRKLLDDFLMEKKKNQTKAEACEMELHNDSGLSNSSIPAGKGNDAVDEDIDIGGSEHPRSSFLPVEVDKDTANKNSRCSSPSSSSSHSGSSSSVSGSSGRESEGTKTLPPDNNMQLTVDAQPNADQNHNDIGLEVEQNQSRSSLSQVDQICQTKPLSVEVDKEGESAPSERQVSPDKLYRAALLRSRFADTILKAQEKTLDKGETRDPEKLRLEREELERRQREEKARLQAEARAAEVVRRKAAAAAAAEAKKKRELEREAARLALQKMEKTVDINENCQFMEDIEMFSAAPADNLSSFMGDASPNDSQNGGLGSFRFRGNSNPLEQLGLYRKDDDEEEEEVETPYNPPGSAANDVEEGEID